MCELLYTYKPDVSARDNSGRTALHHCCRGGNLNNLIWFLKTVDKRELNVEARSNGGVTPLMSAIQSGNVYLVAHCLKASFDPFAKDFLGQSCLDYAAPFGAPEGQKSIKDLIVFTQKQWE